MAKIRRKSRASEIQPDPERVKELEGMVRDKKGHFKKGVSGRFLQRAQNESNAAWVGRLAREWTEDAIYTLGSIMVDGRRPEGARIKAAQELLNRGFGKSPIHIEKTLNDSRSLEEIPTHELVLLIRKFTDEHIEAQLETKSSGALPAVIDAEIEDAEKADS